MEPLPPSPSPSADKFSSHVFRQPKKEIISQEDVEKFKSTKTFQVLVGFIMELQKSVESKNISSTKEDPKFNKIISFLEKIENLIGEVPPLQQKMRFGNKAFKTWHEKMALMSDDFFKEILPESQKGAAIELKTYLLDSFGSYDRIDYGTGHELSFLLFLLCLRILDYYTNDDFRTLVHTVFYRYIKLMRNLQSTYMLEPAGSHGVWGLDDYHFLPFLLGSSELINHPKFLAPALIHDDKLLEEFYKDYMYLDCIRWIKEAKKGTPFYETSPVLNDISAALNWKKVSNGMIKMYQGEVLFKHPVIKHMYFGSLIPFS